MTIASDRAPAVSLDTGRHRLRVLHGELAFAHIEGAALGAQDEEAVEAIPIVHGPHIAAGRVLYLPGPGNGLRLGNRARREVLLIHPDNLRVEGAMAVRGRQIPADKFCAQVTVTAHGRRRLRVVNAGKYFGNGNLYTPARRSPTHTSSHLLSGRGGI